MRELNVRPEFLQYFYHNKKTDLFVICGDNGRFFNHSKDFNTECAEGPGEGYTIASRDINPGEELLVDYEQYDIIVDLNTWVLNPI
jgi:SET domain-containing protein